MRVRVRSSLLAIAIFGRRALTITILGFWAFTGTAIAEDGTVAYGYIYVPAEPANAEPRIRKVELNSSDLEAGGPIAIRVTTTRDAVSVVTGSGKHEGELARVAPGVFVGTSKLPRIGGFLRVHIKLHFRATAADGSETEVDVPVTYK